MAQRTKDEIRYSRSEEAFNRSSHALATLASLAGLFWLMHSALPSGDPGRIVGAAVFGAALVLFYAISTVYHTVRSERRRALFRKLDHVGIYLLIAGTYTPITLVTMRDGNGLTLFVVVWGLALAGILLKALAVHSIPFLGPALYVGLGWLIVVDLEGLLTSMAPGGVAWLVAGGVIYTVGILFYGINKIPHHHGIWHLFVVGGSICHFVVVGRYVLPA